MPEMRTGNDEPAEVWSNMNLKLTKEEERRILDFRHDMHMHPELSHREFRTTANIKAFLKPLTGIEILSLEKETTGLVARLVGGKPGDEVGLRADIDAICQTEENDLPWKSCEDGIMHACGHDFHTAGLLGAAMILSRNRDEVPGTVDFLFQEAEETTDGAKEMIDAGLFHVIHPAAFFGEHNRPEVACGKVVCKNGALMAAKTNFVIRIIGRGGHGSMPHLCVDPIVASAAVIQSLQTVVSRNTDPLDSVVLSVGSIHGGSIENLVVDKVEMTASIRALSLAAKDKAVKRMETIVKSTAEAYECQAEIEYREILPLTFNGEEMYRKAVRAAQMAVGSENVIDVPPTLASEDFSMIMDCVPSFFYWIGSGVPGRRPYAWHQSRFMADDAGVKVAAEVMAAAPFAYAEKDFEGPTAAFQ